MPKSYLNIFEKITVIDVWQDLKTQLYSTKAYIEKIIYWFVTSFIVKNYLKFLEVISHPPLKKKESMSWYFHTSKVALVNLVLKKFIGETKYSKMQQR